MSSSSRKITTSHLSQEMIKSHLERTRKFLPESLIFICGSAQSPSKGYLAIVHQLCDDNETPLIATRLTFPSHPDSNWIQIHGSCDGLVLVEDDQHKIFVLNPVTRELRYVPLSPFAFRPFNLMYGFGYDSVNHDYKVVTLSVDTDTEAVNYDVFVSVYSLKTGTWKNSGEVLLWNYDLTPGVNAEGRIHWKAVNDYDFKCGIMAFDLTEDKFYKVPPPRGLGMRGNLKALSGQLCMVSRIKCDVWVMKEYGAQDSWTKLSVDQQPEEYKSRPLCKLGRDRVMLLQQNDRKLVAYHLNDKTRKEIFIHGTSGYEFDQTCFVESLVSSHGYNL